MGKRNGPAKWARLPSDLCVTGRGLQVVDSRQGMASVSQLSGKQDFNSFRFALALNPVSGIGIPNHRGRGESRAATVRRVFIGNKPSRGRSRPFTYIQSHSNEYPPRFTTGRSA